jgi:hypothetical protein
VYIGVAKDPYKRFKKHQSKSSSCLKLKYAMLELGKENFNLEVLCCGLRDYILDMEEKLIETYDSASNGYNILKSSKTINQE